MKWKRFCTWILDVSLMFARTSCWTNNRVAGEMRFNISCLWFINFSSPTCTWNNVPPPPPPPFNTFSWNDIVVFWLKFEFMPECPIKSQHWFIHDDLTPTMRQAITNPTDWHTHMITRLNGAPSQQTVLQTFFYMFRDMNLKPGIYIQQVAWHMRFEFHHNQVYASGEFSGLFSKYFEVSASKLVYTLSRLHNIFSLCFTRMGFLWPSSCS